MKKPLPILYIERGFFIWFFSNLVQKNGSHNPQVLLFSAGFKPAAANHRKSGRTAYLNGGDRWDL